MTDDEAVSAVVGAVLIFSVFSTAMVLWTFNQLPDGIEQNEHDHARLVSANLVGLKAGLDGLSVASGDQQMTASIPLAPKGIPIVQSQPRPGTLEVESNVISASLTTDAANTPEAFVIGGVGVMTGGAISGYPTLVGKDGHFAQLLSAKIEMPAAATGHAVTLTATQLDSAGAPTAKTVSFRASAAEGGACGGSTLGATAEIRYKTTLIESVGIGCGITDLVTFPLSSQFVFGDLVESLGGSFTLAVTASDSSDKVAVVAERESGTIFTYGTGIDEDVLLPTGMDRLIFRPQYQEFKSRTIAFEAGGIMNIEEDGSSFQAPPLFDLSCTASAGTLEWTLFNIAGTGSRSGADVAQVRANVVSVTQDIFQIPSGGSLASTIAITTPSPGAWMQLFQDEQAGLCNPAFATPSATTASIDLTNTIPWTVELNIITISLSVT